MLAPNATRSLWDTCRGPHFSRMPSGRVSYRIFGLGGGGGESIGASMKRGNVRGGG